MKWYNSRYPHDPIDINGGPFVLQAAQLIQGSPHAANRWQENLHAQLTTLGYVRNNIDHSFYTKRNQNNELDAMLSVTVDDFLLSYRNDKIQKEFYDHLSAAFDITTPSTITKLKFLSLTIYQSEYGTSIDQTNHIQSKILAPWFNDGHSPKVTNTSFPTDSSFECDLSQSPPLDDDDLLMYEKRYHGAFNHTIGKLLHIQQWTRYDIHYTVTRLATFTRNPNKQAFIALEHLMRYIHSHLHEPIFYPKRHIAGTEKIDYKFSTKQSQQYSLSLYPTYYSDSSFGNILPTRRSMQSNCCVLNGAIISSSTNIQTTIAADSTDAELRSIYSTVKKIISFSHFLASSSFHDLTPHPVTLYADNRASINIILQNKISPRSRHLDIPVTFSYEHLQRKYFSISHIDTKLNAADISTKPTSGPLISRHWSFLRGHRFYPPEETQHGQYIYNANEATNVLRSNKR